VSYFHETEFEIRAGVGLILAWLEVHKIFASAGAFSFEQIQNYSFCTLYHLQ
jgi:hypothetical protein